MFRLNLQVVDIMFVILVLCFVRIVEDANANHFQRQQTRPRSSDEKIHGGRIVDNIIERPYMAYLQIGDKSQCMGTIVTSLYVLTACHCLVVYNDKTKKIYPTTEPLATWVIVVGATNLRTFNERTMQLRVPQSFSYHPNCKLEPMTQNDAGLVKVSVPFNISAYVKPVNVLFFGLESELNNLMIKARSGGTQYCTVSGWGRLQYQSLAEALGRANKTSNSSEPIMHEDPFQLRTVTHIFISDEQCFEKMWTSIKRNLPELSVESMEAVYISELRVWLEGFICGISKYMNETTCAGDSGAGFICKGSIFGVNSWGYGCGTTEPDVFQSLLPVFDWFQSELCTVRTCQDAENLHENCPEPSRTFTSSCTGQSRRIPIDSCSCVVSSLWIMVLIFAFITQ